MKDIYPPISSPPPTDTHIALHHIQLITTKPIHTFFSSFSSFNCILFHLLHYNSHHFFFFISPFFSSFFFISFFNHFISFMGILMRSPLLSRTLYFPSFCFFSFRLYRDIDKIMAYLQPRNDGEEIQYCIGNFK